MRLIQLEQTHIREIMTSRFVSIETLLHSQGTKLDGFIGKMDALVEKSLQQGSELSASPLGRQVDHRLNEIETWVDYSKDFHARLGGMGWLLRGIFGVSAISMLTALFALAKSIGWI